MFLCLLLYLRWNSHNGRFFTKIKRNVVFNKEWKLCEIVANHLEEMVELFYVVNSNKDVSVHFLDFKQVIEIGSVVILACVAFAALYNRVLRILMLFV